MKGLWLIIAALFIIVALLIRNKVILISQKLGIPAFSLKLSSKQKSWGLLIVIATIITNCSSGVIRLLSVLIAFLGFGMLFRAAYNSLNIILTTLTSNNISLVNSYRKYYLMFLVLLALAVICLMSGFMSK